MRTRCRLDSRSNASGKKSAESGRNVESHPIALAIVGLRDLSRLLSVGCPRAGDARQPAGRATSDGTSVPPEMDVQLRRGLGRLRLRQLALSGSKGARAAELRQQLDGRL